ncbi:MAG: HNH endonuclease [Fusobacteriaceae bacterium]
MGKIEYTKHWIFFNNPAKWDLEEFLKNYEKENLSLSWSIPTHQIKNFQKGQFGLLRVGKDNRTKNQLTGKRKLESGIYALVRIEGIPRLKEEKAEFSDKYILDGESTYLKKMYCVDLKILANLVENPLLFDEIKSISEIANDKYLIPGFLSSSMPLSKEAFEKISKILEQKNQEYEYTSNDAKVAIDILDRETLVKVRIGQEYFKEKLISLHKKCCICGLENRYFLIGSHIKPWSQSENREKLDEYNGLLLCSHHDAAFDKGYISFEDTGKIIISEHLSEKDCMLLNINPRIKIKVHEKNIPYLKWHREYLLKG